MPQYGQSPWAEAGEGISNVGGSMARIALAQQMGRQKAQQWMQQQALEQAYLRIAQQKAQVEGPEVQARTGLIDTQRQAAQQNIGRQGQMDDLARQVAGNMFQKQVPGGVPNLMGGGVTAPQEGQPDGASPTNLGPSMQNASALNQGDLVRNATQLMAMNDPNSLERMSHGVNVPRGAINVNQLTGEQTQGMPPAQSQAYYGMTPYQTEQIQMQRERLGMQQDLGNRRMDSYDEQNMRKTHALLSKLYEGLGELDKAKEEADLAGSGGNEEKSDGSKQDDIQGVGKPLDPTTAKQFLYQAGGDKDAARKLAKQAGYSF